MSVQSRRVTGGGELGRTKGCGNMRRTGGNGAIMLKASNSVSSSHGMAAGKSMPANILRMASRQIAGKGRRK